jgi:tetratricopeptide (TPR) repeat protein
MRYYWYGYYPYQWYGYAPVPYEVQGDTYNYYTYNYYTTGGDGTATQTTASQIQPVDENTYKDVREKLAQEKAANQEPAAATTADTLFDEGVTAFGNGDYAAAAEKFANASALSPEDMVLPFAQSQAFLALENYTQAAQVLRTALLKVTPEKEGVFYPRGLYPDDDVLLKQIDQLKARAAQDSSNADLQLLLGYQLLGTGEIDSAVEPLKKASLNPINNQAATTLIKLLDQIRAAQAEENKSK